MSGEMIEKYIKKSVEQDKCPVCRKPLNKSFVFPTCLNPCCPAHPVNNCAGNTEIEIADFQTLYEAIVKNAMNEKEDGV